MTAEQIARVVADLRVGRAETPVGLDGAVTRTALGTIARDAPVVDASALYRSIVEAGKEVYLYEDHPCIAPPFEQALLSFENEYGNVYVVHLATTEDDVQWDTTVVDGPDNGHSVDWDRVRWRVNAFVWVGGWSATHRSPIPTYGPVHTWQYAIYEDGEPADLHWTQLLPDVPRDQWDNANLVTLAALNFLNCSNAELVEPTRERGERRRLERTGVAVHEINVFPAGRRARSTGSADPTPGSVPLTSIRGHFARYGPRYGRGLLFGKYAGRYWIPQHARGHATAGETHVDYKLVPDRLS